MTVTSVINTGGVSQVRALIVGLFFSNSDTSAPSAACYAAVASDEAGAWRCGLAGCDPGSGLPRAPLGSSVGIGVAGCKRGWGALVIAALS
eukprot:COSAG02_NODE_12898_length_1475_cov_1.392442_2_plen_91_part_00